MVAGARVCRCTFYNVDNLTVNVAKRSYTIQLTTGVPICLKREPTTMGTDSTVTLTGFTPLTKFSILKKGTSSTLGRTILHIYTSIVLPHIHFLYIFMEVNIRDDLHLL